MPMTVSKEEFLQMSGQRLRPSAWLRVDQQRIDLFADATDDHQFIHVDPEKAARTPFGATIAHGFLSLAMLPHLSREQMPIPEGLLMGINYGLDRVRFLQPVKVGSEVRLHSQIIDVAEKTPGRVLVSFDSTVEIRGQDKPALVAKTLLMYVLG